MNQVEHSQAQEESGADEADVQAVKSYIETATENRERDLQRQKRPRLSPLLPPQPQLVGTQARTAPMLSAACHVLCGTATFEKPFGLELQMRVLRAKLLGCRMLPILKLNR